MTWYSASCSVGVECNLHPIFNYPIIKSWLTKTVPNRHFWEIYTCLQRLPSLFFFFFLTPLSHFSPLQISNAPLLLKGPNGAWNCVVCIMKGCLFICPLLIFFYYFAFFLNIFFIPSVDPHTPYVLQNAQSATFCPRPNLFLFFPSFFPLVECSGFLPPTAPSFFFSIFFLKAGTVTKVRRKCHLLSEKLRSMSGPNSLILKTFT